jgi:hypothetical protein
MDQAIRFPTSPGGLGLAAPALRERLLSQRSG